MGTKVLLVYPEMPPTYWSMRYALPFLGRKATLPPLGLLTVAAMLPEAWDLRLLDMNVEAFSARDLDGVDLVMISAMLVQRPSFEKVVGLCRKAGKLVVAGGPYPTSCHEAIAGVDVFVLGEAETNLPPFLQDYQNGTPQHLYHDPTHPPLNWTPPPRYDLVDRRRYAGMALQYSRGCPHQCEFCDIVELNGHIPRTKTPIQFMEELDVLFRTGWEGALFIVDDNFIGNPAEVRRFLPYLARWQAERDYPFSFFTEASLDLASDDALMESMVQAGFNMVFVGIETPDRDTLAAAHKLQNTRPDMLAAIHTIQAKGMEVSGGFILGFDGDKEDIFDRQVRFIAEGGIPTAMVGLLTALPGTQLHRRLAAEGRLLGPASGGNNTHDLVLNFRSAMDPTRLREGYTRVLAELYTPRNYFARCLLLLDRLKIGRTSCRRVGFMELHAAVHSVFRQTFSRYGWDYLGFLWKALRRRPRMAPEILALAIKGHHYITLTDGLLALEDYRKRLAQWLKALQQQVQPPGQQEPGRRRNLEAQESRMLRLAARTSRALPRDLQAPAALALEEFCSAIRQLTTWKASPEAPTAGMANLQPAEFDRV